MSALGKLVASVVLETADFTGGTEKAEFAAARMATTVDKHVKTLENSVNSSMKGVAAALAGGFSVAALAAWAKHSLDAADEIGKAAQKAGMAVEEFSKFAYAAKISDVSTETLQKGIKGLSEQMVKATDATSKEAAVMRALGIDIGGGVSNAIQKAADTFAGLPDGATKAALAVEVFGKAGMEMIPFLNQGAAGIERLKVEAERLGLVMSGDTAKAAEQFNDNMRALGTSSQKLGITFANDVAPALATVTDHIKEAYIEGGKLHAMWVALGAVGTAMFTDDMLDDVQRINKELAGLEKTFKQLQDDRKADGGSAEIVFGYDQFGAAVNKVTMRMSELRAERTALLASAAKEQEVKKAWQDYYAKEAKLLEANTASLLGNFTARKHAQDEAMRAAKKSLDEYTKAAMDALAADDEMAKGLAAIEDKTGAAILATEKNIAQIQFETSLLGLSNDEREKAIALRALETSGIGKETAAYAALKGRLTDALAQQGAQRAALDESRAAAQNQLTTWNDLADVIVATFHRGKDALKDFARSMLDLFAKKYILQIGAAVTGSTALSAAANTMGNGTAAGAAGNALGLGLSGFGSLAGAGGGALTGGTMGAIANGFDVLTASASGGSLTGMAAGAGQMLAAAGPYIAFAAVAYGLYKAFAAKAGGPKEGGSYSGMFNDVGALSAGSSPGWYGVSTQNANVQQLVSSTGLTLAQSIARYGGTSSGFSIGLGYDADPRGTANSRLTSSLTDASGRVLFGHSGMDIGRGNEGAALSLEMSRLIVEGLKASNINEEVRKLFDGFTGTTQEAFDALFASAEDLNGALTQMASVTISGLTVDALKQMALAGESLSQTAARVTGSYAALQDMFSTDAEKRARDEKAIADAFAAINVAVPDSISGFKALIDSIDLSTDSGRDLYDVLVRTGPKFKELQGTITDMVTTVGATAYQVLVSLNDLTGINIHTPGATAGGSSISNARQALADQLRGSLVSDASPYTIAQRYATAKAQFDENVARAQGGDESAINSAFSLFQTFTSLSRQVNASSGQYNTDYFGGLNALGGLTQGAARPFTAADYNAGNAQIVTALAGLFEGQRAQTSALVENTNIALAETNALIERLIGVADKPVAPGALTGTF